MAGFITSPHKVIAKRDVKTALRIDKGINSVYKTHHIKDTLNDDGSRYGSKSVRLVVEYLNSGDHLKVNFIVRFYSTPECLLGKLLNRLFDAEAHFYSDVLPKLNHLLIEAGEVALRTPEYVYNVMDDNFAVTFFRDVRSQGYRPMIPPFDDKHTLLYVDEIARFHAASMMLFSTENITLDNIGSVYPVLKNNVPEMQRLLLDNGIDMLQSYIDTGIAVCRQIKEYNYVADYLKSLRNINRKVNELIVPTKKFFSFRHSNFKCNNAIFR